MKTSTAPVVLISPLIPHPTSAPTTRTNKLDVVRFATVSAQYDDVGRPVLGLARVRISQAFAFSQIGPSCANNLFTSRNRVPLRKLQENSHSRRPRQVFLGFH